MSKGLVNPECTSYIFPKSILGSFLDSSLSHILFFKKSLRCSRNTLSHVPAALLGRLETGIWIGLGIWMDRRISGGARQGWGLFHKPFLQEVFFFFQVAPANLLYILICT